MIQRDSQSLAGRPDGGKVCLGRDTMCMCRRDGVGLARSPTHRPGDGEDYITARTEAAREKSEMAEKDSKPRYEFKLRRTTDGLFSGGGMSIRWTKAGKTWRTLGPLKNHLHQHGGSRTYCGTPWEQVEIVQMELRPVDGGIQPVLPVIREMAERMARKKAAQAAASKRYQLQRAEAEVARLKKEIGK